MLICWDVIDRIFKRNRKQMQKFAACGSAFSISSMLSFRSLEERVAEFACVCSVWFLLLFSFPPREMLAFVSFFPVARQNVIVAWKSWATTVYISLWFAVVVLQGHPVQHYRNLSTITSLAWKHGLVVGWQSEKQFFLFHPWWRCVEALGTMCLIRSELLRSAHLGQWLGQAQFGWK